MYFVYILAAISPAILILLYAYKQDFFPEPPRIVFKTFIFGCATVLAVQLIIPVLDTYSEKNFTGETYYFFDSFIRAAFLEEFFKLVVIVFYCTRKSVFDEPMDGLIYGVAASLGFAAYENIEYIVFVNDYSASFDIALSRALTAVPAHALFGIVMGFFVAKSIFEKKHNYIYLILAILIPVLMHGSYNYSISSDLIHWQFINVFLFVSGLAVIFMFKSLKRKQKAGIIYDKKYYEITLNNFVNSTTTVLLIYLVLNYLVNLFL
jgi:protease PrsW|tara:strand:+ start:982 stop:1773 length:792 start_codon:yes stop_codon:yes gene_type:complete